MTATDQRRVQPKARTTKKRATKRTPQFFRTAVHAVTRLAVAKGMRDQTARA